MRMNDSSEFKGMTDSVLMSKWKDDYCDVEEKGL